MKPTCIVTIEVPVGVDSSEKRSFRTLVREQITETERIALVFLLPKPLILTPAVLSSLLHCIREAADHDVDLAIVAPHPQQELVLELTRLSSVVPTFNTLPAAHAYLERSPSLRLEHLAHSQEVPRFVA